MHGGNFMYRSFIPVLILFSIYSCQQTGKQKLHKHDNHQHGLKLSDSISIQNPPDGNFMSWDTQIINDTDYPTLVRLSYKSDLGLEYIDLKQNKLIKKKNFIIEGSEGLGKVQGFYIINKDSIAIFNDRQLILVNDSFEILQSYNYMDNYDRLWYVLQDSNRGQITFQNGKLFFGKTDFEFSNTNAFYNSKLSVFVDLETGEFVEQTGITFPESYFNNCWGDYTTSILRDYNLNDNQFIYSFPTSHKLFIFDPFKDKITNEVYAKSNFLDNKIEAMNCKYYDDYIKER
jgi:hypothetical protein